MLTLSSYIKTLKKYANNISISDDEFFRSLGTTHLYIKFNVFRAKKLLPLFKLTRGVCANKDNIFIQFCI
jgi:hypothetical protein